ncbi:ABC-type transport auxiliary lipoprotein family protein [Pseudomonas aeruginosa]|uniref:ABC-type transport auxiliary lipoprotein family protein n=1 Tax=Pseudomonas aeruginosa TaxID=287 RepID=UPI00234A77EA|nr:ABC-type transport auxiliary lipoprotein family protein [Pseudomonas aeruginosa]MDG4084189.1 ABC-type transport auxiliary lipoprotein family protein [Pseudomonas aeruginosa]
MTNSKFKIPAVFMGLALMLGASACSVLPKPAALVTYKLPSYRPIQIESSSHHVAVLRTLRIYLPEGGRFLGSERIVIARPDGRLSAWQGVRWADPAPVLLRERLAEAFLREGQLATVVADNSTVAADLELRSTLNAFQLEHRDTGLFATVQLDAQLVDPVSRRIIASRRFEAAETTGSKQEVDAVAAFGSATDRLNGEIVDWVVQAGSVGG